jgi:hypothetical protein
MIRILAIVILLASTVIGSGGMTQTSQSKLDTEIPGKSLKWIHIAERVFAREGLDLDRYTVIVFEEENSVSVLFRSLSKPKNVYGSVEPYPDFEVEISKKTKRVIRSNYSR